MPVCDCATCAKLKQSHGRTQCARNDQRLRPDRLVFRRLEHTALAQVDSTCHSAPYMRASRAISQGILPREPSTFHDFQSIYLTSFPRLSFDIRTQLYHTYCPIVKSHSPPLSYHRIYIDAVVRTDAVELTTQSTPLSRQTIRRVCPHYLSLQYVTGRAKASIMMKLRRFTKRLRYRCGLCFANFNHPLPTRAGRACRGRHEDAEGRS